MSILCRFYVYFMSILYLKFVDSVFKIYKREQNKIDKFLANRLVQDRI